ncbi:MAG: transporter substrate-binding domain-containing protein [Eubacteriales bacterium]|nr:transporter substrate-binding domain-containing protein [Eubacteriales bacterium]MDD4476424.1 transporter substrate-binding domain-containing protein [Eubacteriales bacterium]
MRFLKNFLFIIILSTIVITLAGCRDSNNETQTEHETVKNDAAVEEIVNGNSDESSIENLFSGVRIVTEDYRPFNYKDTDGIVKGTATERINAAMDKLGVRIPINVYTWSEAYDMAMNNENVLIYSMARTKEREKLYKWISKVGTVNVYIYSLKDRDDIKIDSIEDAKNYTIGTVADDFTEQGLKKMGFNKQLTSSSNQSQSIRLLFEKKVDLWIASVEAQDLDKICKAEGYDSTEINKTAVIEELRTELWLGANANTSDEIINRLSEGFGGYKNN